MTIRIGTRASALALAQATWVGERLAELSGEPFELVHVTTEGDVRTESLASLGGQGVFIAAVRQAILDGRCDVAVHSMKDLPCGDHPDLAFGAIPAREVPADVLCARDGLTLATLPLAARVGTGSPRRAAQLRRARPDLRVVDLRGNVPTRLRRVTEDLDAVVLARAGLARLGLLDAVTEELDMVPAAGQGALAVECLRETAAGATPLAGALAALDDAATRLAVTAERAVLSGLGASCTTPVGAHGRLSDGALHLRGVLLVASRAALAEVTRPVTTPEEAAAAGAALAGELRASAPRLAVLRERPGALAAELEAAGVAVVHCPVVRTEPLPVTGLAEHLSWLGGGWLVLTSPRTVDFLAEWAARETVPASALAAPRCACVGPATARAAREMGLRVEVAGDADAERLVELMPTAGGTRALLPGSALTRPALADGLAGKGYEPRSLALYRTITEPPPPNDLERAAACDAVLAAASSQVEAWAELGGPRDVRWIAMGRPTAATIRRLGMECRVAPDPTAAGLLTALAEELTNDPKELP
ncbi:MAG: hydroxymethylbilane synthase [Actinobacteria bacterium]|nr:hydroxymethylbilane synthase [Actinomycetota bacterium]